MKLIVAEFEVVLLVLRRHPEGPRFHQRAAGSRAGRHRIRPAPDPSLRLKNATAQDDAVEKESVRNSN